MNRSWLLLLVLAGVGVPARGQNPTALLLKRAAELNDRGEFRAALDQVGPLLGPAEIESKTAEAGMAWNIRGLALQNLGNSDQARRSYEMAIEILKVLPTEVSQYAAALENLGSLEAGNGQLRESKKLRTEARELYRSIDDHAGLARASTDLALVALAAGNRKEAHRNLSVAFDEAALESSPDARDLAWTYSAQCLLEEKDGDFRDAATSIDHAIELWTERFGPKYYQLALGYSLRASIYQALGDFPAAGLEFERSLKVLADNDQARSETYFLTEIAYANALRRSGRDVDAKRIDSEARTSLDELDHKRCGGCTISAESLR